MSKRGVYRVLRGGSYVGTWVLRTTHRGRSAPEGRIRILSFRIVVRRRKRMKQASRASCASGRLVSTTPGSCAPPTASGSRPSTATAAFASSSCGGSDFSHPPGRLVLLRLQIHAHRRPL